tara:strand:+ start:114 stop:470 length:357 start_codon:yes stop_codon:yes gene_type:complete
MENKYTRQMMQVFDLLPTHLYQGDTNTNKRVASIGASKTLTECGFSEYRQARVEKLAELYEKHNPEIKKTWVLPKGETDGRKSIIVEEIIGEDISPFDLPDFEEQMPNWEDYVDKYGE